LGRTKDAKYHLAKEFLIYILFCFDGDPDARLKGLAWSHIDKAVLSLSPYFSKV
jgi:hypothetical protein